MRQRDDDGLFAESFADAVLERARSKKSCDGELSDRDDHPGLQQTQLVFEPVPAVCDSRSWWRQVACVLLVAAWKAPHQRGDVCPPTKFLGVLEARPQHPAVELLARASGERPPRFALRWTGRLADDEELRAR